MPQRTAPPKNDAPVGLLSLLRRHPLEQMFRHNLSAGKKKEIPDPSSQRLSQLLTCLQDLPNCYNFQFKRHTCCKCMKSLSDKDLADLHAFLIKHSRSDPTNRLCQLRLLTEKTLHAPRRKPYELLIPSRPLVCKSTFCNIFSIRQRGWQTIHSSDKNQRLMMKYGNQNAKHKHALLSQLGKFMQDQTDVSPKQRLAYEKFCKMSGCPLNRLKNGGYTHDPSLKPPCSWSSFRRVWKTLTSEPTEEALRLQEHSRSIH